MICLILLGVTDIIQFRVALERVTGKKIHDSAFHPSEVDQMSTRNF